MKSKRIFTILGIVLTTLTLILGTYAYWLWSSNDNTSLAATIGELAQVSFITGDSITVTDMAPVLNYNDGETVSFVARNNSDVNLGLYVDLEITQISTALQVEDFKWVFLTSLDEENYEIAESGTFLDQGTGTVTIAEGLEVNSKTRLYCKFIVYIDGSKQNSNDMMNKTFKANLNALMDTTDKVAPTLTVTTPASSTSSSPSYASSTSYSVTGTSVDEVSGINAVYIKVGDGEYQSFSVTEDGNYDGVVTLQEGLNTISIYSEDKSFNSTEVITRYVYYDTSGPTLTVTAPTGTSETSPTYTSASSYEVRGTTSDSESGISGVTVNDEAATVSGTNYNKTVTLVAGINTITVVSTNQAGLTATLTRYVYYDDTNPSLTVTNPEGTSESSPTYSTSTSYTVSGTASDSESGLKTVTVNGEAASVSGSNYSKAITLSSGVNTITIVATDNSGRTTTITRYAYLDEDGPDLTVSTPTGTSSSSPTYTTSSSYTVSGNAVDSGSSVKGVTVNGSSVTLDSSGNFSKSLTLTANTATKVTVIATDNVDRTSTVTRYVYYDDTNPSLTVTAPTGTSTSSPTYTTSSTYTVTGTASDSESGLKSLTINGTSVTVSSGSYSKSITLSTGSNTITVVATDNSGRTTTITRYIYYDNTAPTLTVSAPTGTSSSSPTYTTTSSYTVSGTASDSESGLSAVTVNGTEVTVSSGSYSQSLNLTAGSNTITVVATDKAGKSTTVTRYVYYDNVNPSLTVSAPTGSSTSSPTYTNSLSYTVTGTAADSESGLSTVTVNGTSVTVSSGSFSKAIALSQGSNTVTVKATDKAGRSTTVTRYIYYDNSTPSLAVSAPTGSSSSSPTYTTSSSYTVTGTASDSNSGLDTVTVNGTSVTVSSGSFSKSVSLTANSVTTITVIAKNKVGNSATITRYVYYDNTAPSLTVSTPAGTSSSSPTYTSSSSYTVTGTASDNQSGLASVKVNGTAVTVGSDGSYSTSLTLTENTATTVTVVATDKAGKTTTVTRYVYYDNEGPVMTVTAPTGTSTSSPTYTTSSSYTVTGTVSDTSGVSGVTVNGSAATVSSGSFSKSITLTEGSNTITVVGTDNTGKTTTITRYIYYDNTAPTLTVAAPTGTSSSSPTYTTSSTYSVTGTASDSGSGLKSVTVNGASVTVSSGSYSTSLTLTANTSTTITVVATDKAGKTTTVTRYVYYDSTNPSITVTNPAGTSSSSPTYTTSSTYSVTGTASDSQSGLSTVYVKVGDGTYTAVTPGSDGSYSKSVTLSAGTNTISVYSKDVAGRTSSVVTRYVCYDSAVPSLTVTAPTGTSSSSPTYTTASSYTVSGTASDSESGLKSVTVNGTAVTVSSGSYSTSLTLTANTTTTVTVVATDNAGRTTTVTRYVYYDNTAPSLTVTNPSGTSSSSPTYTTSSSYTVSGTASDSQSGLKSVTVNGTAVTVSSGSYSTSLTLTANTTTTVTVVAVDNAGKSTTVTRYVYYDNTNPSLTVSAPTGTNSSSPTYYQSDSTATYTVSGTVSDTSGVASVTVNGTAATVSDTSWSASISLATNTTHTITIVATDSLGNQSTETRYVRIEAYYQYAARIAGTTVQTSLANTLTNSTVTTAIAGNSTAYTAMKNNYSSTMTSYIDSNWNTGLNLLNYKCSLKCYLFKAGNECTNITGGYVSSQSSRAYNSGSALHYNGEGTSRQTLYTTNTIALSGYTKLYANVSYYSSSASGNVKIVASSTQGDKNGGGYIEGTGEMYTTDISGTKYVGVVFPTGGNGASVNNIWLIP